MWAATEGNLPPVMPHGNLVDFFSREVRQRSPGELMVESSPCRQRRQPCKTNEEMSDEAADAAALTYLLTYWVNRVQNQLNHVLTQASKLDESGHWAQQANWSNRGIPLWVWHEKFGSDACDLKEEEIVQKGQAAEAQAPAAKRKSTGEEPAPERKRTASKPQAANSGTGEDTDDSNGDEEKESEDEEEE